MKYCVNSSSPANVRTIKAPNAQFYPHKGYFQSKMYNIFVIISNLSVMFVDVT